MNLAKKQQNAWAFSLPNSILCQRIAKGWTESYVLGNKFPRIFAMQRPYHRQKSSLKTATNKVYKPLACVKRVITKLKINL